MARRSKRPKPVKVGHVSAVVVRGPKDGRWYWRGRIFRDGKQYTIWTGWGDPDEVARELAALVAAGEAEPRDPKDDAEEDAEVTTVRDLLQRWVGAQRKRHEAGALSRSGYLNYRKEGKAIVATIGDVLLDRLDLATLERHRDERLRAGFATGTVQHEIKAFRAAWSWGRELGLCPDRSVRSPKLKVTPTRDKHTPTHGDVATVLRHLDGWPRMAVRLLHATGARIGELAALRWRNVDLDAGVVTVDGKTGPRTVPLADEVVADLAPWRERADGVADLDALVLGVSFHVVRGHLSHRYLKHACKAAGVRKFTPHGLRRLAVDSLARSAVDIGTAAALLGHSPQVMLEHYRQVSVDDRRRAVAAARLGALPAGTVISLPTARAAGSDG